MADEQDQSTQQATQQAQEAASTSNPLMRGGATVFRGLSQALMQGAFEKFGQAFTDTGDRRGGRGPTDSPAMQGFREAGARAAQAMEYRWYQMEYKSFDEKYIQPYVQQKQKSLGTYSQLNAALDDAMWPDDQGMLVPIDVSTPEGRARALRKRNQLTTKFFNMMADQDMNLANDAYKYAPNNPLINDRIQNIIETTTQQLGNVAQPPSMPTEVDAANVYARDREAEASKQNAATNAANSKQAKGPTDIPGAVNDPTIGIPGVLPWMMFGGGQAILNSDTGQAYVKSAEEQLRKSLVDSGKFVDAGPGTPETEALDREIARLGDQARMIGAVEMLRATNPVWADQAKLATPQYFTWENDGKDQPKEVGLTGRVSKKQLVDAEPQWQHLALQELDKWSRDPRNPTDPEAGIEYIISEWLPKALVGDTPDNIDANFLFEASTGTAEARQALIQKITKWLKKNWQQVDNLRDANLSEARGNVIGPGGFRGTLAARRRAAREKGLGLNKEE